MAEVWQDGPPVRIRDLVAITGLHQDTIYQDIEQGELAAAKRNGAPNSPFLIGRLQARIWLAKLGLCASRLPVTTGTLPDAQLAIYRNDPDLLHALITLMGNGLGNILKNAIATANSITGGVGGLQSVITVEAWTGLNGYGKATYASAVNVNAVVERKQQWIRSREGREVLSRARISILEPMTSVTADSRSNPIDLRDRITLPDGTTGPILDVQGPIDPDTSAPFFLEVVLG